MENGRDQRLDEQGESAQMTPPESRAPRGHLGKIARMPRCLRAARVGGALALIPAFSPRRRRIFRCPSDTPQHTSEHIKQEAELRLWPRKNGYATCRWSG